MAVFVGVKTAKVLVSEENLPANMKSHESGIKRGRNIPEECDSTFCSRLPIVNQEMFPLISRNLILNEKSVKHALLVTQREISKQFFNLKSKPDFVQTETVAAEFAVVAAVENAAALSTRLCGKTARTTRRWKGSARSCWRGRSCSAIQRKSGR